MRREERIKLARQRAAETAPVKAAQRRAEAEAAAARRAELSPDELHQEARVISNSAEIEAMGPDKTPSEWEQARRAIRDAAIAAARTEETITYDEIRLVAYESTRLRLGYFVTGRMCAEVNQPGDDCLLSAIIVNRETGRPGEGFEPFAAEQGFDQPLPTLQRMVYEHFGSEHRT